MRRIAILAAFVSAIAWADEPAKGTLTVNVRTMSDRGIIRCALWPDATGFPEDVLRKEVTRIEAPNVDKHAATCTFTDVAAGTYAVTVLHDLNSNNALEKNMLGIPKEPLGFSNNATAKFRAPRFDEAKFEFDGTAKTLDIVVR